METRCQISMCDKRPNRFALPMVVRFLVDSRAITNVQPSLVHAPFMNGLERAFTRVPAKLMVSHFEAARRDQ